jgi:hypothetical protein
MMMMCLSHTLIMTVMIVVWITTRRTTQYRKIDKMVPDHPIGASAGGGRIFQTQMITPRCSVRGQVQRLSANSEKERTGVCSKDQPKVKRMTYSITTKLNIAEKYNEWRNKNLEVNRHLLHTFMQKFDLPLLV